jgi:hypothetical protein
MPMQSLDVAADKIPPAMLELLTLCMVTSGIKDDSIF